MVGPQVAVATRKAHERGAGHLVEFRHGDFMDLPFADATFDIVLNHESLCYAVDKFACLQGARLIRGTARLSANFEHAGLMFGTFAVPGFEVFDIGVEGSRIGGAHRPGGQGPETARRPASMREGGVGKGRGEVDIYSVPFTTSSK